MSESEWPLFKIDLSLLSGAYETGRPLYLIGSFGGFGGSFFSVHKTYEDAREFLVEHNISPGSTIYKLELPKAIKYIGPNGEEVDP